MISPMPEPGGESLLELEGTTKSFGGQAVLKGISLSIKRLSQSLLGLDFGEYISNLLLQLTCVLLDVAD